MSRITPPLGVLLLACFFGWQVTNAQAGEALSQKPSLYIGIENNRRPYAYFTDKQQAQGLLVAVVTSACRQLELDCHFVGGLFNDLVQSLQNIKLNAVVVIDPSLPPEVDALKLTHPANIDRLKLTQPLCQITPVFIQKKLAQARSRPEDFKGTTIGVQEGSVFHSYLLANYGNLAHLKSYPLLESAIVDLVFDRIDAVLADEAFVSARVFESALDEYANLVVTPINKIGLAPTSMTLAVRDRDTDLLKQLSGVLTPTGKEPPCVELLATVPVKLAKK